MLREAEVQRQKTGAFPGQHQSQPDRTYLGGSGQVQPAVPIAPPRPAPPAASTATQTFIISSAPTPADSNGGAIAGCYPWNINTGMVADTGLIAVRVVSKFAVGQIFVASKSQQVVAQKSGIPIYWQEITDHPLFFVKLQNPTGDAGSKTTKATFTYTAVDETQAFTIASALAPEFQRVNRKVVAATCGFCRIDGSGVVKLVDCDERPNPGSCS